MPMSDRPPFCTEGLDEPGTLMEPMSSAPPTYFPPGYAKKVPKSLARTKDWSAGEGRTLTHAAADALIEAQRLMDELIEVQALREGVLNAMDITTDAEKCEDTRMHSKRMAVCALLANQKLPPHAFVNHLVLASAAIFHDIGKLHKDVYPVIASPKKYPKGDPRFADDWAAIMRHPKIGADLFSSIPNWTGSIVERAAVVDAIYQHHERQDGSGYYGIYGSAICKAARLLGFVDSADAMRDKKRKYKDVLPPKTTMIKLKTDVDNGIYHPEPYFALKQLYKGSGDIMAYPDELKST